MATHQQPPGAGTGPGTSETAADEARRTAGHVRDEAGNAYDDVARHAGNIAEGVAGRARQAAEESKDEAAGQVETFSKAIHASAERLREDDQEQVARWVDDAAGQIEHLAGAIRSRDVTGMLGEVETFARRQPALFMGAAVALGFGLARFAKATPRPAEPDHASARTRPGTEVPS